MNQFLAMLRDSVREAIDGWVFLTMFVLSGIVLVLVGSVSVAPAPATDALPKMLASAAGPAPGEAIAADRGNSDRKAIFLYKQEVADVVADGDAATPWATPVAFTVRYVTSGGGAAGVETELDDKGQPKLDKLDKTKVLFGDPFQEAARFWAAKPGEAKPDYTDALGREFVVQQIRLKTGLDVTDAKPRPKAAAGGGGFLGGLIGGNAPKPQEFEVTATGGTRAGWAFEPSLFFGAIRTGIVQPLGRLVYLLESTLVNGVGVWIILMTGVVITASFIPNMLRKGQIDLLLSKPIARPLILLYKYVGGLVFVFLLTAFTLGGVWAVVGVRTGVWATGLLWCVPVVTGYFAILYAVSTLVGVLTRNGLVAIVATVLFWFTLWLIGFVNTILTGWEAVSKVELPPQGTVRKGQGGPPPILQNPPPAWAMTTITILNKGTPRTNDLDDLSSKLIADALLTEADRDESKADRKGATWAGAVGVSLAYIGLFLGLAMLRFVTRSY